MVKLGNRIKICGYDIAMRFVVADIARRDAMPTTLLRKFDGVCVQNDGNGEAGYYYWDGSSWHPETAPSGEISSITTEEIEAIE
jgi:hypothetical protein